MTLYILHHSSMLRGRMKQRRRYRLLFMNVMYEALLEACTLALLTLIGGCRICAICGLSVFGLVEPLQCCIRTTNRGWLVNRLFGKARSDDCQQRLGHGNCFVTADTIVVRLCDISEK